MLSQTPLSLLIALAFAAVHVFGKNMIFLRTTPRSAWLSLAGGVSVAYVFVHLLPELAEHQETFRRETEGGRGILAGLESHTYLIALVGLAVFYGLDRLARTSARNEAKAGREKQPTRGAFWLHLGSFAIYNVLIGYLLLHREETDLRGLIVYGVAMGLHFVVNDQGLREHHGKVYDRQGRWILAVTPLLGWGSGLVREPLRSPSPRCSLFWPVGWSSTCSRRNCQRNGKAGSGLSPSERPLTRPSFSQAARPEQG